VAYYLELNKKKYLVSFSRYLLLDHSDARVRESLLKGKAQYSWPPSTN